jgi:hypothetical protein
MLARMRWDRHDTCPPHRQSPTARKFGRGGGRHARRDACSPECQNVRSTRTIIFKALHASQWQNVLLSPTPSVFPSGLQYLSHLDCDGRSIRKGDMSNNNIGSFVRKIAPGFTLKQEGVRRNVARLMTMSEQCHLSATGPYRLLLGGDVFLGTKLFRSIRVRCDPRRYRRCDLLHSDAKLHAASGVCRTSVFG